MIALRERNNGMEFLLRIALWKKKALLTFVFAALFGAPPRAIAAEKVADSVSKPATQPKQKQPASQPSMDYGPFLSYSVTLPRKAAAIADKRATEPALLAVKGITVKMGN